MKCLVWIRESSEEEEVTQKVRIQAYPNEGEPDYAHLNPVVEFLIKNGNSSANEYI